MKHIICFLFLWAGLLGIVPVNAQEYDICPTVPDFTDLNQPWVVATYGMTDNPFERRGVINGRHTVLDQQGEDPVVGEKLKFLPQGVNRVVRLGNWEIGAEAESVTYHFKVDRERPVLLLNFAVVLEDPDHEYVAQPRFVMRVSDKNGDLVESCTEYDVRAGGDVDGFQTVIYRNSTVRWRDWTSVGLNLSAYAGEELQVSFITYDCEHYGHFGYAYFYAGCIPARLSLADCAGEEFELKAPDHFASYLWSDGQTSNTVRWSKNNGDRPISCELTSATGCRFSLHAVVKSGADLPLEDKTIRDTVCEGDPYVKNSFNLPPQFRSDLHTATFLDVADCDRSREVKVELELQVVQKYFRVEESICAGEDFSGHGFEIRKPPVGTVYDTLPISTQGRCGSYRILELNVAPTESQPRSIVGETSPCGGSLVEYRVSAVDKGCNYEWECPENFGVTGGIHSSSIVVRLPQENRRDTIYLNVVNGCGEYKAQLPLHLTPAYYNYLEDSVCSGMAYRKGLFSVPPREEPGRYVSIAYGKTVNGCDSTIILGLQVCAAPEVEIELKDSVYCMPEEVTLTSLVEGKKSVKPTAVGDILCTDGNVIPVAEYPGSGKEALGIVFWIDPTGAHGWAVDIHEPAKCAWGTNKVTIPATMKEHGTKRKEWLRDFDGYRNTQEILKTGPAEGFRAFIAVAHAPGWYLPAAGQLDILFTASTEVNAALAAIGGDLLGLDSREQYWSSTVASLPWEVCCLEVSKSWGFIYNSISRVIPFLRVRGIRDF